MFRLKQSCWHWPLVTESLSCLQLLPYINQQDDYGDTALHKAAFAPGLGCRCGVHWCGNPEAIRTLVCLGADEFITNNEGLTPLGQVLVCGCHSSTFWALAGPLMKSDKR